MRTTIPRPPHLDSLGDEEIGWADVMPVDTRLEDLAVDCDRDAERCFWEALDQRSEQVSTFNRQAMTTFTHLIAPAAVFGSNRCLTSFPKFLSSQNHLVHAKRTQRGERIEGPREDLDVCCITCCIHR